MNQLSAEFFDRDWRSELESFDLAKAAFSLEEAREREVFAAELIQSAILAYKRGVEAGDNHAAVEAGLYLQRSYGELPLGVFFKALEKLSRHEPLLALYGIRAIAGELAGEDGELAHHLIFRLGAYTEQESELYTAALWAEATLLLQEAFIKFSSEVDSSLIEFSGSLEDFKSQASRNLREAQVRRDEWFLSEESF